MADEWIEKKAQKRGKSFDEAPAENGIEDEPDFSDPEDYVDDITDEGSFIISMIFYNM